MQVTSDVFEASGGRLKVVGRAGVGVDNVDLAAATQVRLQLAGYFTCRIDPPHQAHHAAMGCGLRKRLKIPKRL